MITQIKDKSNGKIIDSIKDKFDKIIYEAWKRLTVSGIPPLLLNKSKGEDLIDYKIYGNVEGVGNNENIIVINSKRYAIANNATTSFDADNLEFTVTDGSSMWGCCRVYFTFRKGKTYTVSVKIKETNSSTGARLMIPGGVFNNNTAKYSGYGKTGDTVSITFTAEKTVAGNNTSGYVGLYPYGKDKEYASATFSEITVIEGTPEKPYVIPIAIRSLNMCEPVRKSTTTTYSGVEQTIDENGVVTYNGTATATSFPSYAGSATFFLPKGEYTLCGNMTGRALAEDGSEQVFSFFIQEDDSGNAVTLGASSTTPVRFTTSKDYNCKMYVYISKKNVTFDNVKYYPMLVKGHYSADEMPDFEPYKDQILEYLHLEEPLGNTDYIDFEKQKIFRNGDTEGTDIELPNLKTLEGNCYFDVYTEIQPSNAEVIYLGKN